MSKLSDEMKPRCMTVNMVFESGGNTFRIVVEVAKVNV